MKVKLYARFYEGKPTSLDEYDVLYENVICGGGELTFSMRSYVPINGHDDSLPYQADLYLNGVGLCHCFNDGWGGETKLTPMGKKTWKDIEELNQRLKENYSWSYKGTIFNLTLDFIADTLACCKEHKSKIKK